MTILEELVQIVHTLRPEQQRRVLDIATKLRDTRGLPDVTIPPAGADDAAWDAWSERVQARSAITMEEEKRRLQALGVLDQQGNLARTELPEDMRPSSKTSVET